MDAQELKKALQRIADMGPDTSEMSTAHEMAQIAADALAERAVSPAESVQSVDTPEGNWPKDFREVIKACEDAAHAEGRRSAMEELAKEKERADRAEADRDGMIKG